MRDIFHCAGLIYSTRLVSEVNVTPPTVFPCSTAGVSEKSCRVWVLMCSKIEVTECLVVVGDACEVVDTTAFEGGPSTLLARNSTSHFIEHLESGVPENHMISNGVCSVMLHVVYWCVPILPSLGTRIVLPSCVLPPGMSPGW